jgi:hypothetical protein
MRKWGGVFDKETRPRQGDKAKTRGPGWNFSFCVSLSNLKRLVFKFVVSF